MMDEQIFSELSHGFVEPLLEFCDAPAPEPEFISELEQRLLERQTALSRIPRLPHTSHRLTRQKFSSLLTLRRWQYAAILFLIALVAALLAIGPRRVLAQVQRWLGYVPGVGFVDLAEARVLVNPVEMTREGVTLRVEQVIADPERTKIVIAIPGLSEGNLPWPNHALERPEFNAFLLLPDGNRLEISAWELGVGAGKLEFPALPSGVHRVTLLVPRLPLVPAGALPEDWEIPLLLRSANELNAALFPQPYSPPGASDSQHGITLRVLDVAQTSSETAIHYQVEWRDPNWQFRFGLNAGSMPELRDDLGHIYWERLQSHGSSAAIVAIPASEAAPTPVLPSQTDTLVFPAVSLSARRAALWVDSMGFWVPVEKSLHLDLGDSPKVGDSWPLDIHLDVAGFPVHLTGARLREETVDLGDGKSEQRPILKLSLDPLEERDGVRLFNFDLANRESNVYGSAGQSIFNGTEVYGGRVEFTAGKIPKGILNLQITDAMLMVPGPWELNWTIPGKDSAGIALPVRLYPKAHGLPGRAIQPIEEEAFLSDRLTAVRLDGTGLPAGATFVQALASDPSRGKNDLYLEDNWGRRYNLGQNEAILRPGGSRSGSDPRWQFFAPLQPFTQNFSLHIPAIEVFQPASASFEVEVPQGLSLKKENYGVTMIGGGGPQRQETQTHWVSDPWSVDIPLEIAGYQLHFTKAQVQRDISSDSSYLLFLTGEPVIAGQGNLHLNELRISKIDQPDGRTVQIEDGDLISYPYGGVGPAAAGSDQLQAMIVLDVTDANQEDLLSGRYRVEIRGVTSWIPGPWTFKFSLTGK